MVASYFCALWWDESIQTNDELVYGAGYMYMDSSGNGLFTLAKLIGLKCQAK